MFKRWMAWMLVILWMSVIFMFSHQPATLSAQMSGGILNRVIEMIAYLKPLSVAQAEVLHHVIRKLAHLTLYAILGALLFRAIIISSKMSRYRFFALGKRALIIGMFYAMTDEIHQLFIAGRGSQFQDVIIDSCGVFIGIMIYYSLNISRTLHRY